MAFIGCTKCLLPFKNSSNMDIYATTCGHLYHEQCLMDWELRPHCLKCPSASPLRIKIEFTFSSEMETQDINKINDLAKILSETEAEIEKLQEKTEILKKRNSALEKTITTKSRLKRHLKKRKAIEQENDCAGAVKNMKLESCDFSKAEVICDEADKSSKTQRSISILHYPEAKVSSTPVSIILSICKIMSLDEITELDIVNINLHKSVYSSNVKIDVEFATKFIRDKFFKNRTKLYCFRELLHSSNLNINRFMSNSFYDIWSYGYYYLGIQTI